MLKVNKYVPVMALARSSVGVFGEGLVFYRVFVQRAKFGFHSRQEFSICQIVLEVELEVFQKLL